MLALTAGMKRVECVGFSPDGTRLAVGGSGLEVWKVPEYRPEWRWEPTRELRSILFTADGGSVFGLGNPHGVDWYDARTGDERPVFVSRGRTQVSLLALDPGGGRLLLGLVFGLHRLDFDPTSPISNPDPPPTWSTSGDLSYSAAAFLPGHDQIAAVGVRGTGNDRLNVIELRSADSGELIRSHRSAYGHVDELVASPDGAWLAARRGSVLLVWDANRLHKVPLRLETESRRHLTGLAFHPSGRWLATASNDKSVRLWDAGTWAVTRSFTWAAGRMRSVAFAPDGLTAAAGGEDGRFVVFDVDG